LTNNFYFYLGLKSGYFLIIIFLLFKILEVTLLIADYMNALGQTLPGTPQTSSLTRHGSHRSQRSRAVGSHCNSRAHPFNMTTSTDTA